MPIVLHFNARDSTVSRRILGIDPGTNVLGFGVLQVDGNHAEVVVMGVIEFKDLSDPYSKLSRILEKTTQIIKEYKPDELAIEAPFFGKNIQSMLKLGRAQGVCIAAATMHNLKVNEYAPTRIKQSITGNGNATKETVAKILHKLLNFEDITKYLDATDALGAAYCHFLASSSPITKVNGAKDWKDFVAKNPNRITKQ